MNLNLRCPEIFQMTKMTSIINKMTVEKPNLILEARYCGELIGEI